MNFLDLDINLSPEQQVLKQAVGEFSREVLRPAAIKLDSMSPEEVLHSDIYWNTLRQIKQLGYHTIYIPEKYGGLGLSPLELHIFWEELAFGSAGFAVALGVDTFPATMVSLLGSKELKKEILFPFIEDKEARSIGCWAITEPDHGSDWLMHLSSAGDPSPPFRAAVTAELKGDRWLINGAKAAWVSNGPVATHALLFVHLIRDEEITGGGIAVCPLNLPGISRGKPLNKLGQRELLQGELNFDQVEMPLKYLLVTEDMFELMSESILSYANVSMGAIFTGVARAALEETLNHVRERKQGGRLLCQHQNVQSKLFKMFMATEAARALSRDVLNYNMQVMPPAARYSITAKVFCTETAFRVAHEAVTLFGASGLSKEYYVEKLFRDARAALIEDGSNDVLGLIAVKQVLQEYL